jgi:hypothetical protein
VSFIGGRARKTFFMPGWAMNIGLKYVNGVSDVARRVFGIVRYLRSSYDFGRFEI